MNRPLLRFLFGYTLSSQAPEGRVPKSDRSFDLRAYATVAERITLFYRQFPDGRIITELAARDEREVTFKALAYRHHGDAVPAATGWASERYDDGGINSVACLENTETSAVGRALANLGFTASLQRPSREEMERPIARGRRRSPRCTRSSSSSPPHARSAFPRGGARSSSTG
jgi:hypothetical protein